MRFDRNQPGTRCPVVLVGTVAMLVLVGEAAAGSITLRSGDEIQVAHTQLHCGTFASDGAIGIECFKATSLGGLAPGTFGVDLTPQRATIFRVVSAHHARNVVTRAQKQTTRKTFPRAKQRQRRLFTLGIGDRVILGGTDIVCGVAAKPKSAVIGCGHVDDAFNSIRDTWGMSLDLKTAAVFRSTGKGNHVTAVSLRYQP